jgi:sirohydrochlorin ferrochelatase
MRFLDHRNCKRPSLIMNSLILIAHGSRRPASNAEVQALTDELRRRVIDRYDHVACGFLEFAQPTIAAAIDDAVRNGHRTLTILPYFLAGGNHIMQDVPALIDAKKAEYPHVIIEMKPHIGAAPAMIDLLAAAV